MPRFKAQIAYDGSAFSGFAPQSDKPSVLESLQNAFAKVGITSQILGASRTDSGVHATRQVISFESSHFDDTKALQNLLNAKLYPHIAIRHLSVVDSSFHPRFSAKSRTYRMLLSSTLPSPFSAKYISYVRLDNFMRFCEALKCFEGTHNFIYFKKNGSSAKDFVRTIYQCKAYQYKGLCVVNVRGSGFLRAQVRLMVGASVAYANNDISLEALKAQIAGKSSVYRYPISPNGLYLCGVGY